MPDKTLLKIICLCSLITGVILGFLPLIPKLSGIAFITVMFLTAPFVIIYLYKLKLIDNLEMPKCITIGAISGFFSFLGFSFIYFPSALIMNLVFKINNFLWIKVLFTNIGFLVPMIILTALLSALLNMFSAFITLYIYENLRKVKK